MIRINQVDELGLSIELRERFRGAVEVQELNAGPMRELAALLMMQVAHRDQSEGPIRPIAWLGRPIGTARASSLRTWSSSFSKQGG